MRWLWAAVVASGCLQSSSQPCASGGEAWVCPSGFVCAEVGAYCARADEVAACAGQSEFASCTIPAAGSATAGRCVFGVCNACDPATAADLEGCTYTGWEAMTSPTSAQLNGVWSIAPADAYVVGDGALLHYDGNSWSVPSGLPALGSVSLGGVWASGSADVFAVASAVGTLGGDVLQFDGTAWSVTPAATTTETLDAVWGVASNNVYAVGGAGLNGVVRQFDGSAWTTMEVGNRVLTGVWASSDLAVAVGGGAGSGVIWRSTAGGAWTQDVLPTATPELTGVWGSSDQDVFAIGQQASEETILHFDGSSWSLLGECGTSPVPCIDSQAYQVLPLYGISGRNADDVYTVSLHGAVFHFDGSAWSVDPQPSGVTLDGVAVGSSEVFAVGMGGEILRKTTSD